MMRLFAALPLGGAAADEVGAALAEWRATGWPVRWVRPGGLHVTVKFFGAVPADQLEGVAGMLAAAVRGTGPITLAASEYGAFPTLARARVLWAGYQPEPALELLVHRVERGAAVLGFAVEGRPFRPHATLGRLRDGARLPPEAVSALEGRALAAPLEARELVLYQSVTGPGGARYDVIRTFDLGS